MSAFPRPRFGLPASTSALPPSQALGRMGIAEVSKILGLTQRAIRFYEERGLIAARRDLANHRYFDTRTVERLRQVTLLRRANLPLAEVAAFFSGSESPPLRRQRILERLHRQRRATESLLRDIDRALNELDGSA